MLSLIVLISGLFASLTSASTPAEWRQMTSIYQVMVDRFARTDNSTTAPCDLQAMTYCGGTWQGLINRLDYIQGMGFDAIWISPVSTNTQDGYHGYWTKDLYTENPFFGTADDLKALSAALHARKMYLMVDVETNDMGLEGTDENVDYAQYTPFNNPSYFHTPCDITDFNNQTQVEVCRLFGLPDLNTTNPQVISIFNTWIQGLISNFTVDGLRIDGAKQIDIPFMKTFDTAANVYTVGEVFNGDPSFTCPYQGALSGVANYPIYYPLLRAFQGTNGSISGLIEEMNAVNKDCTDPTLFTNFIENADLPRFANMTSDASLMKNAQAFSMLSDGIPVVYQGQEQGFTGGDDPTNREALWLSGFQKTDLYNFTSTINDLRRRVISQSPKYTTSNNTVIYNDTTTIGMLKGVTGNQILTVLTNTGEKGANSTVNIEHTGFTQNEKLVEVFGCTTVQAGVGGSVAVPMSNGLPKVYYSSSGLNGTSICVSQQSSNTTTSSASSTSGSSSGTKSLGGKSFSVDIMALTPFVLFALGAMLL
ncbi:hypothetical protein MMC14_002310 [Varicellaria rhodocarpa]|nr:hypothetical protein [Varicellaria rhodocarpa]